MPILSYVCRRFGPPIWRAVEFGAAGGARLPPHQTRQRANQRRRIHHDVMNGYPLSFLKSSENHTQLPPGRYYWVDPLLERTTPWPQDNAARCSAASSPAGGGPRTAATATSWSASSVARSRPPSPRSSSDTAGSS